MLLFVNVAMAQATADPFAITAGVDVDHGCRIGSHLPSNVPGWGRGL